MASPDTDGAPPAAALAAPHSADSDGDGDCDCDGDSMFVLGELPPLVLLEGEGVPEATDDEQAAAAFAAFAAPAEAAAAASAADGLVTPRSGSKVGRKPVNHFHVCGASTPPRTHNNKQQRRSETGLAQGRVHQRHAAALVGVLQAARRAHKEGLLHRTGNKHTAARVGNTHACTTVCGAVPARQLRGAHGAALAHRLPVHHVERAHAAHRPEPRPPRPHPERAAAAAAAPVHARSRRHSNSNSNNSINDNRDCAGTRTRRTGQHSRCAVAERAHTSG